MILAELDPELFSWELYNMNGVWELDDAFYVAASFGYCDALRLAVRPRTGQYALMVEWPNGEKCWFHICGKMLEQIKRRIAKRMEGDDRKGGAS